MIPGFLVTILTFPGVMMHELAHLICCKACDIQVYDVKYFQIGIPAGYVSHEVPDKPWKSVAIAIGPFFINTIIGIFLLIPALFLDETRVLGVGPGIFLCWLGISLLMHSFPSTEDAGVIVQLTIKNPKVPLLVKIIAAPFIGLVYLISWGSVIWLDLLYALAVLYGLGYIVRLFLIYIYL